MRGLRSSLGLLGTLALAGLPAPAGAQAVGSEFQINTYTTAHQSTAGHHLVAADASGNFVVVWRSGGQDGSFYGVFGQRYDSLGQTLGSEFRANSFTTNSQQHPSVAAAADGDFVVVWDGVGQEDSTGIFGQRYDSAGVAQGAEFRVNSYTTSSQTFPSVASDASGNFVVVWDSNGQDGSGEGIFGQRYDSEGVAQGGEFRVNSYTTGFQVVASVASDASGNFVVVWESIGQDGSYGGIFGQRYDSGGVAQGDQFRVNSYTTFEQRLPSVASDASGNFVVVWHGRGQGDTYGIFGQRYDSGGVAQGNEFQINSYTTLFQDRPSVGATGTNQFVVAWESYGQDGSGFGVFGQRFDFSGGTITVVSPNTNVNWRIGSLQKIKWTHNLGLAATFRIELDRDDDGTFEELIAAAAPVDSATKGSFVWTVTGPPSATARVRVSWTDDPAVSDSGDVTFQIRPLG